MNCLCLGPSGSGKSLLLKQLQNQSVTRSTVPIETVGTNIVRVSRSAKDGDKHRGKSGRGPENESLEIREVGGSMGPLWPSYYNPAIKSILFVIDASNLFQVSISTMMLMEILSHSRLTLAKVLIILTKMDLTTRKKINYLKFMMRLESILQECDKRVTVEEVSGLTGDGIEKVRSWIFKNSLPSKTRATASNR